MMHTMNYDKTEVERLVLSTEEIKLIQKLRKEKLKIQWYNEGVLASSKHLEDLASQCCGGSGEGGEIYKTMADSLRRNCFLPEVE